MAAKRLSFLAFVAITPFIVGCAPTERGTHEIGTVSELGAGSSTADGLLWRTLRAGEADMTVIDGYDSIAEVAASPATTLIIKGTPDGAEAGIAYADGGSSAHTPIAKWESPNAVYRWVVVDVRVDEVLQGDPAQVIDDHVRVEFFYHTQEGSPPPDVRDFEAENAGEGIFFLQNSYTALMGGRTKVEPEIDPDYHKSVFRLVADSLFVDGPDGVEAPFLVDSPRAKWAEQFAGPDADLTSFASKLEMAAQVHSSSSDH